MTTYLNTNIEMKRQKKITVLPIVFLVGLLLLLFIRDLAEIQINKFIILFYVSIFLFVGNISDTICMICAMLPLLNGLPGTYIMLVAAAVLVLKKKSLPAKVILLTAIFALLEVFASIWFPDSLDISEFVGYILTIFLFFYLLTNDSDVDLKKCLIFYFVGVVSFCLIDILSGIKFAVNNWIDYLSLGQFRFGRVKVGEEGMRIGGNANELAYYAITGFSVGLAIYKSVLKKVRKKVILLVAMIFVLLAGALSLSRSYILAFIILMLIYLFANIRGWKNFLRAVAIILIFGVAIFIIIRNNPEIYNGFVSRFTDETVQTGGGRFSIYETHIKAWFSNVRMIFLGAGVINYVDALGLISAQHNMFLQIIECYGIVGASVYFIAMFKPLVAHFKDKLPVEMWMPVLAALLFTQSIQFVNPYSLMLHYTIGIIALQYGRKNEETKNTRKQYD